VADRLVFGSFSEIAKPADRAEAPHLLMFCLDEKKRLFCKQILETSSPRLKYIINPPRMHFPRKAIRNCRSNSCGEKLEKESTKV